MKKPLISLILCLTLLIFAVPGVQAAAFHDIADAETSVAAATLQGLGVVSGTPDGSFQPNGTLTRAQVCVMAVNNETGVCQPIKEIASLCKQAGVLCFADCVQAYPHQKINARELGVDMLSISSHKISGPKGVGALYIRSGVKIERLVGGGEQERGLRGGTLNTPAIVGFGEAVRILEETRARKEEQIRAVSEQFLKGLDGVEYSINGEGEERIPAILNLHFAGVPNASLLYRADLEGLMISAGSACASASVKPSHVLTAMGLDDEVAKECVRVSFGEYNTLDEAKRGASLLKELVSLLRK